MGRIKVINWNPDFSYFFFLAPWKFAYWCIKSEIPMDLGFCYSTVNHAIMIYCDWMTTEFLSYIPSWACLMYMHAYTVFSFHILFFKDSPSLKYNLTTSTLYPTTFSQSKLEAFKFWEKDKQTDIVNFSKLLNNLKQFRSA